MTSKILPFQPATALKTLADISHIITSSHDTDDTLAKTADLIAERMKVDVCSIYVCDVATNKLVLKATHGLNAKSVNNVGMLPSEGLVGLVLQSSKAFQVSNMSSHPRFKFIPETGEERYSSFLGTPLIEHRKNFGVLVLHTIKKRVFSEEEVQILVTIGSQISGLISKALLIAKLTQNTDHREPEKKIKSFKITGTTLASGVGLGEAFILRKKGYEVPKRESEFSPERELELFNKALELTISDVMELINQVSEKLTPEEAAIFHVHLMFLEDKEFITKITNYIESEFSAAWSIYQVTHEYLEAFSKIDDPYLKERGTDIKDISYRLLFHLGHGMISSYHHEGILVSTQILPSDIIRINPDNIKGIITSASSVVSHAAILARTLFIPALCVSEEDIKEISTGCIISIDGNNAFAVVNPSENIQEDAIKQIKLQKEYILQLSSYKDKPCVTKDGTKISLLSNVGLLSDVKAFKNFGTEGIGLYRTEMYFLSLDRYPELHEQVTEYSDIIKSVGQNQPVVFRTLDVGFDKAPSYMGFLDEENPALGTRAIRHQYHQPKLLKEQIKAIMMASSPNDNVSILFPMISHLHELKFAKNLFYECKKEVTNLNKKIANIKLGMMFEVPSAILTAELFIDHIDFISIGSNDLAQYVLAIDRNNPTLCHLYDPLHPSMLKLYEMLVKSAHKFKKPISLCGELASDPEGCILLIGLGLKKLSMNPAMIPLVKDRISHVTIRQARKLAKEALKASNSGEVRQKISNLISN